MSEKAKKVIIGMISGGTTGIIMEFLRGSSYLAGVSVATKAVLAGIIAWVIYLLISAIIKPARPAGASKT